MRDYWLTKDLLQATSIAFIVLSLTGLGLALALPKKWWGKLLAVVAVGFVIALPVREAAREKQQAQVVIDDYKERYTKAKALFDERCKTAGEKIYKTVEGVEGVLLMRLRPEKINLSAQYQLDDPYGRDFGGEEYIASFMWGQNSDGSFTQSHTRGSFKFIEVEDVPGKTVKRFRAVLVPRPVGDVFDIRSKLEESSVRLSKYGVHWADLSTKEDRDQWIAGSLLQVVDLEANKVIAERIGYMFDSGLGDQTGGRSPWAYADRNACPPFEKSSAGNPVKTSRSRGFILRVLKPLH